MQSPLSSGPSDVSILSEIVTVVSPAISLWTGHLPATTSRRLRCSSLSSAGSRSVTVKGERRGVAVGDVHVDLDRADLPALALGVHLDRHRGAAGEAGGEQAGGRGPGVGAARGDGLIDRSTWPPSISTSWAKPSRRRATTFTWRLSRLRAGPRRAPGHRRRRSGPSRRRSRRRG